jgi:hypothetical protein
MSSTRDGKVGGFLTLGPHIMSAITAAFFLEYTPIIPSTEFITHGDECSEILGYGPIDILVKRVDGSIENLRLNKVFHAPGLKPNIVVAEEAEELGFFWNRRK